MERPNFADSGSPSLVPRPKLCNQWFTFMANSVLASSFRDYAECHNIVVRDADVGEKRLGRVAQTVGCHQQRFPLGSTLSTREAARRPSWGTLQARYPPDDSRDLRGPNQKRFHVSVR